MLTYACATLADCEEAQNGINRLLFSSGTPALIEEVASSPERSRIGFDRGSVELVAQADESGLPCARARVDRAFGASREIVRVTVKPDGIRFFSEGDPHPTYWMSLAPLLDKPALDSEVAAKRCAIWVSAQGASTPSSAH